jgi:hypothetical protein
MSISQNKFAAAARLAEEQFLRAAKNWLQFLTLQDGTLILIMSSKEAKNVYPKKDMNKKSITILPSDS